MQNFTEMKPSKRYRSLVWPRPTQQSQTTLTVGTLDTRWYRGHSVSVVCLLITRNPNFMH